MNAHAGDEHLAATADREQVARAGHRERGEQQPAGQLLDQPEERELEQEEADVLAEHRVHDGLVGRERHPMHPQEQRLPGARHGPGNAEGEQHREPQHDPGADRDQVGQFLGSGRERQVPRALATARPERAERAAARPHPRIPVRLALGLREAAGDRPQAAGSLRVHRRGQPARQDEVADEDHQCDQQPRDEQADLRPQARPEHRVEADAAVPDGIGPQVDAGPREQDDQDDDDDGRRQAHPAEDVADRRPAGAVIRATDGAARWPPRRTARGPAASRPQRHRLGVVSGRPSRPGLAPVVVACGPIVDCRLVLARPRFVRGVRRLGLLPGLVGRLARAPSLGLGATALQLAHELVEQVTHHVRV